MKLKLFALLILITTACSSKHDIYKKSNCACKVIINHADLEQVI